MPRQPLYSFFLSDCLASHSLGFHKILFGNKFNDPLGTMISLKFGPSYRAVVAKFERATLSRPKQPLSERRPQLFSWRITTIFHKTPIAHFHCKRRQLFILVATFPPLTFDRGASAEEEKEKDSDKGNDEGLVGGLLSLFDPNEKTKSGKIMPKSYLKSAREVVKNLRESLKENPNDNAKFRRSADSAKESIKEFMQNWTGQKSVASEDSYTALVSAIRVLANFYSKKGPFAAMPEDIKSKVLDNLNLAESAL